MKPVHVHPLPFATVILSFSFATSIAQTQMASQRLEALNTGWEDITDHVPGTPATSRIGPMLATDGEVYVLGSTGIFRSTNDGDSFEALNQVNGVSSYDLSIQSANFVEQANGFIYIGAIRNSPALLAGYTPLHRISAGESAWTQASQVQIPDAAIDDSVEDIAYDPASGTYFAASIYAGCYTSTDGLTWTQKRNGLPGIRYPFSPEIIFGDSVIVQDGKVFLSMTGTSGGVYETSDLGETWSFSGSSKGAPGTLAKFGNRIITSNSGTTLQNAGIYFTDNGGTDWTRINFLGGSNGDDIRTNSISLFTAHDLRLQFSSTQGTTWDQLPIDGLPTDFKATWIEPSESHLYLLGSQNGTPKLYRRSISTLDLTPTTQFAIQPSLNPSPKFANVGQTVSYSALAAGPNISYQWKRNGTAIPGATASTLNYQPANLDGGGEITLEITGDDRSVESSPSIPLSIIPSTAGFQDVRFAQTESPRGGTIVAYPDGRVAQIEAPVIYLYDTLGKTLGSRATVGDSRIRRGFLDTQGRLVVWGEFSLMRLDPNTLADDSSFTSVILPGTTTRLNQVIELPGQGYLTATNARTTYQDQPLPAIALFDYSGNLVTSFPNPFINSSPNFPPNVHRMGLTPDGKILVETSTARWANGDTVAGGVVRLNADGTRDPGFNIGDSIPYLYRTLRLFHVQPDGKILYATGTNNRIAKRVNPDGSYDATFNAANTEFERNIAGFVDTPSGKIIVYGEFEAFGPNRAIGHARLFADGTFDASYNADEGFKSFNTQKIVGHAAYTSDGKVYLVPGEGGGFRETAQTGLVRVFAETPAASPFLTYLQGFGLNSTQSGAEDDPDGDGLGNLLEFAYQTDPASASSAPRPISNVPAPMTGAEIGAAGLEPSALHYVAQIRLPKNQENVTVTVEATTRFPDFNDGSAEMIPFGSPVDEGDTILQSYYFSEAMDVAPRAFWRLKATQN